MRLLLMIGLIAVIMTPQGWAQEMNKGLRAIEAIIHPEDARRLEKQAHRNRRPDEERYWHEYGVGLQRQGHRDEENRDHNERR
ncbi:MAG TPA: hypothetical protein VGP42_06140 [Stellaceae bacterium]|jgi:hypothetical protein|nr:hypothetical protein [Stellaceae bacterium]